MSSMESSDISDNLPAGLQYLTQVIPNWQNLTKLPIDHVLIHQQAELVEVLTGFETANKYNIRTKFGQKVYYAIEDSSFFSRICCGNSRSFSMKILDNEGREVITLQRPLRCSSCCFPCCLQKMEIQAPPGVPIGYVVQTWHPCLPKFSIQNEREETVLRITGPCVECKCFGEVHFEIKSLDETVVIGRISKHWSGFLKEVLTDFDNFGIQFPLDLDVKMKAVMLGACFLIINQLIVCHRFDEEVQGQLETSKAYEVMNNLGERVYFAEERSNSLLRVLCGSSRSFTMTLYDTMGRDVITVHKALRYHCCWSNCFLQKVTVQAPPGETIGYVHQYFHPFLPMFKMKDGNMEDVMKIVGPCFLSSCLWDLHFKLLSLDDEIVIGNISQYHPGFVRGILTGADRFEIHFPFDLDVRIKALILGAGFLIDYMYLELWP